jgi:hypothetical protein
MSEQRERTTDADPVGSRRAGGRSDVMHDRNGVMSDRNDRPTGGTVTVRSTGIGPADVLAVARADATVALDPSAVEAMAASRSIVDGIERAGRPVSGPSCSTR